MSKDERPQLPPSPVKKSVEQSLYEHEHKATDAHVRVQKTTKCRRSQNRNPHAAGLQCLKEVAAFERFLKNRIHDGDENDERNRQRDGAVKIDGAVKNLAC